MVLGVITNLQCSNHPDEEERVGFFSFKCVEAVCVLCLFLMVPWFGLWSVSVILPGHTCVFLIHYRSPGLKTC